MIELAYAGMNIDQPLPLAMLEAWEVTRDPEVWVAIDKALTYLTGNNSAVGTLGAEIGGESIFSSATDPCEAIDSYFGESLSLQSAGGRRGIDAAPCENGCASQHGDGKR